MKSTRITHQQTDRLMAVSLKTTLSCGHRRRDLQNEKQATERAKQLLRQLRIK